MFLLFPKTVAWKAPGMLLFRRVHGVKQIDDRGDHWKVWCEVLNKGAMIPKSASIVHGKMVNVMKSST